MSDSSYSKPFLGKIVEVIVDRALGSKHPKYGYIYELNYGYLEGVIAPDGEELDAYVFGINIPADKFTGRCIAIVHRLDDDDDKLIVAFDGMNISDEEIMQKVNFQEKYFKSIIIRK